MKEKEKVPNVNNKIGNICIHLSDLARIMECCPHSMAATY
jgi:hypothetical protein